MKQFDAITYVMEHSKEKYTVAEIVEVFALVFDYYEKTSKTVKEIKSKIDEGFWNSLCNGILANLVLSLYTSRLSEEEALKFAKDVEGTIGAIVVSKKEGFDA